MAYEIPGFTFTLVAGADLSSSQYKFVKLNASGQAVAIAATTDMPVGVLQNTPKSGEAASIMGMGITKLQGDVDLAKGAAIQTSADGQAAASATGGFMVGQVLEDNSAAGGLATVFINCANATAHA